MYVRARREQASSPAAPIWLSIPHGRPEAMVEMSKVTPSVVMVLATLALTGCTLAETMGKLGPRGRTRPPPPPPVVKVEPPVVVVIPAAPTQPVAMREQIRRTHVERMASFDDTIRRLPPQFGLSLQGQWPPRTPGAAESEPQPVVRLSLGDRIFFETGRSDIRPEAERAIAALAETIRNDKSNPQIMIVGHADSTGDGDDNLELSRERAESVAAILVRYGVPHGRLHLAGMGEQQPVATNRTPAGRRLNRRVEVLVSSETVANEAALANPPVCRDCVENGASTTVTPVTPQGLSTEPARNIAVTGLIRQPLQPAVPRSVTSSPSPGPVPAPVPDVPLPRPEATPPAPSPTAAPSTPVRPPSPPTVAGPQRTIAPLKPVNRIVTTPDERPALVRMGVLPPN
jgi:outer membrane protein OmpA-like peptidoglycan-associated protein